MGIDGIGGGGKPPIGPPGGDIAPSRASGESFSLERPDAASKASESQAVGSTEDLDRLDAGEISLNDYLQTRANGAVSHLESTLPPEQLQLIKEQLIEQMLTDPTVAALVQRATGVVPSDNEES